MAKEQNYKDMSDEQLLQEIKLNSNEEALEFLICKYKDLVASKVGKYFMVGAERDDIMQEGMIGLYKAIKDYKSENKNSFKSFANLCIERQLITAIKTSNRQKHLPLNSYLSLNMTAYNSEESDNDTEVVDVLDTNLIEDPLDTITKKEYMNTVGNVIDTSLSAFEKKVLNKYVQGESYVKIAQQLEMPVKSVDNAIQRIRKKTIRNLNEQNNLM